MKDSNIARRGYVPAGPDNGPDIDAMLLPKSPMFSVPAIPEWELQQFVQALTPEEKQVLARIVGAADLLIVDGQPWLLVRADPEMLDTLAALDAENEDRENDLEDEPMNDEQVEDYY